MPELSHTVCPNEECSSSDAFSFNTEKGTGYCHSCGQGYPKAGATYKPWVYEDYPLQFNYRTGLEKRLEETHMEPKEKLIPTYVEHRGISKDTMKFFGVQTFVDSEGKAKEQKYIYPNSKAKTRTLESKAFFTERGFTPDLLFGMDKWNSGVAKYVTVTEGELDAMSAYQMLGSKYPCVSLPSATPSSKLYEKCKDWLDSYERIYISFDSDGKSEGVAQKFANLFPNKIYRVPHDKYKDANEFLTLGSAQEFRNAFYNAQKFTPENVYNSTADFISIYKEGDDSSYLPTGIQALDDQILGLMQGHFTIFQAPEGIGKTEFMRFLEYKILKDHKDVPIAICHMEETKRRSVLGLVSYDVGLNLTRKDLVEEHQAEPEVISSIQKLTENENLYQFSLGVDDDPLEILDKIRFFAEACGCKYIFFEPIQDLGYSRSGESTLEQFLSELATKLARLATELNVGIVSIAHENDDGQIRDCRMIGKRASVVVKLGRDKFAETEEVRNTTSLTVVKNRPAGSTGFGGLLRFDPSSFTLTEVHSSD